MSEYRGEPKRHPIDLEPDVSDVDAAETVKADAQLHECNRLAHQGMEAALFYRRWLRWMEVTESPTGGEERALRRARMIFDDALDAYERALRVVSGEGPDV